MLSMSPPPPPRKRKRKRKRASHYCFASFVSRCSRRFQLRITRPHKREVRHVETLASRSGHRFEAPPPSQEQREREKRKKEKWRGKKLVFSSFFFTLTRAFSSLSLSQPLSLSLSLMPLLDPGQTPSTPRPSRGRALGAAPSPRKPQRLRWQRRRRGASARAS